ncbi:uncharacterized protein LOC142224506 [Haematobia irritans]|uniref:uncharacterized protein LOC142224506 n=1 Tax=Haematobia irritans TaxID=7368 RepID=UPI003F4FB63B
MHVLNSLIAIILIMISMNPTKSWVRFTNYKCNTFDPSFVTFEKCELKVIGRGIIALNTHIKLHKVPMTNITVSLSSFKKGNGYRPFLYNISVDLCKLMRNPKRYPIFKLYMDAIKPFSNINHSCPFTHDLVVKNMVMSDEMLKYVPVPAGEYMIKIAIAVNKERKCETATYMASSDQLLVKW